MGKAKGREPAGKFTERRKAQRLKIPILISYKVFPRKKVIDETFSQDISGRGFRLKTAYPLKRGEKFRTLLHFPSSAAPVTAKSEVVWCKEASIKSKYGRRHYNIGMRYLTIAPKDRDRFIYLFCEMLLNYFLTGKESH